MYPGSPQLESNWQTGTPGHPQFYPLATSASTCCSSGQQISWLFPESYASGYLAPADYSLSQLGHQGTLGAICTCFSFRSSRITWHTQSPQRLLLQRSTCLRLRERESYFVEFTETERERESLKNMSKWENNNKKKPKKALMKRR